MATTGYNQGQRLCPLGHKVRSGQSHCGTCGERLVVAAQRPQPVPVYL